MNVTAIVPSAGTGERMHLGIRKPYISLMGRPILAFILDALDTVSAVDRIIVPVYPGEEHFCENEIIANMSLQKTVRVIAGGETRQESVRNALGQLCDTCDLVLVHDGARPLVTTAMLQTAVTETQTRKATTMAVPVKDTITLLSGDNMVVQQTLPRERLYAIQTPQTFERNLLVRAHQRAVQDGFAGTDDASLVERLGGNVYVLMGSYANMKITTKEDLVLAEALLARRQNRA